MRVSLARGIAFGALIAANVSCGSGTSQVTSPQHDASADVLACAPTSGFTSCVHACGETNETESVAASCDAGTYHCPAETVPAIGCPATAWSSGSLAGCGPWVTGYDCTSRAICVGGLWTCPPDVDGASQ